VLRGGASERDLFWPSVTFFVGVCLVAVSFRSLGWETRSLAGRLQPIVGHVLTSVDDGESCARGGCRPMYRTSVVYDSGHGDRVFSPRWLARYQPGESVEVEHAIGRPGMARMVRAPDLPTGLGTLLTMVCGLGVPALIGGLVMLTKALASGGRPDRRVGLVWLAGLAFTLPLGWFIYWC
jgi:hypothetical protein